MKRVWVLVMLLLFRVLPAAAQCAICRSTLENNVSQGNPGIAAGINTGILYLLAFPYVAAMVIAYMWYRHAKRQKVFN
jgi:preprotein translocase subunit SecY